MCGIAGFIDFANDARNNPDISEEMLRKLTPRGPDAGGVYVDSDACLVHRRLIVVDPEGGKQPMIKCCKDKFIMVYNGELYNTEEIRTELKKLGYSFNGHSDTEVLLTAYIEWQEKCVEKLNGIYAFAVWNSDTHSLFMARDRMGVKPLFYSVFKDGIVFASELKALLCHPNVKPVIDQDGLRSIFLLGPAKIPSSGVFKNVNELLPAHYATFNKNGLSIQQYWKLTAKEHTDNVDQTIEHTRFLIEDAATRQLVSDVPLCCFLSGGLDSSILSMLAAKEYAKEGKTLTTYSVDYVDNSKYFEKSLFQPNSDSDYIGLMSDYIHSTHKSVFLENANLAVSLFDATKARDLPGMADIDSSLMMFCEEVKQDFTVAISGECADELFGGYPWYHREEILFEDTFPWSRSTALRESILQDGIIKDGSEFVRQHYLDTINSADKLSTDTKLDSRMREMFMLNIQWFMQTLLDRKDRMSMSTGLEVRVPFCDHRIAEYAYNMPWRLKSLNGREKGIMRTAFSDCLPEDIVWRKKSPYPKTHNPIYTELVKSYMRLILQDKDSVLNQIINKDTINSLLEDMGQITEPWYGQLMRGPQIFAYLVQLDYWLKEYNVTIE